MASGHEPDGEQYSGPVGIRQEGDRLQTDLERLRQEDEVLIDGPREEPQQATGGCGFPCGCLVTIILAIIVAGAVTFWLDLWPEETLDFLPLVGDEDSPDLERQLLSSFYLASDGENWDESENWLSDAPLGEWHGVTTGKGGWVVSLRLPDNGLSGDSWPGLVSLDGLQHLDLSGNRLSGEIPQELYTLSSLSVLLLNGNDLTGQVPARLATIIPNLREFDLSGNRLTGCIPEDFKKALPGSPGRSGIEQLGLPFCSTSSQAGVARATPMSTPDVNATGRPATGPGPTAAPTPARDRPTVAPPPTARPAPGALAGPSPTPTLTRASWPANFRPAVGSYDTDRDGLIGVFNLEQLNAIRFDLDGNGRADARGDAAAYADAFPDASSCKGCVGYELARPLDFDDPDSYASGTVKPEWTTGEGWLPIGASGSPFEATFQGNGYSISNLFIHRSGVDTGLFGYTSGVIRNVGLVDADVTGAETVGGLAGLNGGGVIMASYVTGRVTGQVRVGGLIGVNRAGKTKAGRTVASYSAATVFGVESVGGLVGWNDGSISASYSRGRVVGDSGVGGLLGELSEFGGTVTESYWDVQSSGLSVGVGRGDASGAEGKTTGELQSPTWYTGIFSGWRSDWDNADNDKSSRSGVDYFWDFGPASQYPSLKVDDALAVCQEHRMSPGGSASKNTVTAGTRGRYDTDGNGLIEVSNLEQLDAIRHDLDGDGRPDEGADSEVYAAAFPGYPAGGRRGYELVRSLDFNDPGSYASRAINPDWTTGRGWTPIGPRNMHLSRDALEGGRFEGVLDGNGNTISNLYIYYSVNGQRAHMGFFGVTGESSVIRNLGLVDVELTIVYSGWSSGGLTGVNFGAIHDSYTTGRLWSRHAWFGGLAGKNNGYIVGSFSEASVIGGGGLVGINHGKVIDSHATGLVSGLNGGGLATSNFGEIIDSHATGNVTGDNAGGLVSRNSGTVCGSSATGNAAATTSKARTAGGLFGIAGGLAAFNLGEIGYSHATGSASGVTVGGLAGENSGKIGASYATGGVTGTNQAGGLVGSNSGAISSSYATGSASVPSRSRSAGGLIGTMETGAISASYAHGNVSGAEHVGGLVGWLKAGRVQPAGTVAASYATGSVSGRTAVGGLIGGSGGKVSGSYSTGPVSGVSAVGGLAGYNSGGLSDSYSVGTVTGIEQVGGLVGFNNEDTGKLRNVYWDPGASGKTSPVGQGKSEGAEAKSIVEFQTPAGYAGIYRSWNAELDNADRDGNPYSGIDDFWRFGTSRGYPVLKADLDRDGVATFREFGPQLNPAASPVPGTSPDRFKPTPTPPPQRRAMPGS